MPPLTVRRSPRSIPALRGMEPTSKAHDVPSKAVCKSEVLTMSVTKGKAQSSISMTTPSSAFMAGSISRRRRTHGLVGAEELTGTDAEQQRIADLSCGTGDRHVDGGAG